MFGVDAKMLKQLREEYPEGTRGVVKFVDGAGQLHTEWEGYGTLALICGVDSWRKE